MPIKAVLPGAEKPIKIWTDLVEEQALKQLQNLSALPFIHKHVACMPDVHAGYGSTVGSVIATKRAIIPAAVGVDIGCGMMAVKTNLQAADLPDNLHEVRSTIERTVPHGRTDNGGNNDRGAWGEIPAYVNTVWAELSNDPRYKVTQERHGKIFKSRYGVNDVSHLGTLGTGNHFIEVCLDECNGVWVMLHSGSRGIGNKIGSYFTELAKQDMKTWFIDVPDVDLAYFPEGTKHFNDYIDAMSWAQDYAAQNRELMMNATITALCQALKTAVFPVEKAVNCHHNYATKENHYGQNVWVTRKGAVRARKGDLGIIPGSMGARSYIVEGLGNDESFHSCSHGAGRVMSRTKARNTFTEEDLLSQTEGVECRKDLDVIDEIPGAYKDIDEVMANQTDLVKPLYTLKQVVCVKG